MVVKAYELGNTRLFLKAESFSLFSITFIQGNESLFIKTKDMDYDTADEIFEFLLEKINKSKELIGELFDETTFNNLLNDLEEEKKGKKK